MRGGQYEPDTRADDEHASYSLSRTHDGAHTHRQLMKVETGGGNCRGRDGRGNTFQMLDAQAGQAESRMADYIYNTFFIPRYGPSTFYRPRILDTGRNRLSPRASDRASRRYGSGIRAELFANDRVR